MQHLSTLNDLRVIDNAFQKHCYSEAEETDDSDEDSDATNFPSQKIDGYRRAAVEDRQEECTNSSLCTRQAADYQVLRIQTLCDKLPYVGDYSNDEGPIDFEKSYIWELHKSCGVSQAEKDALAHICESDFDGEISSLIFRLLSTVLLAYSTLDSHTMTWMIL